MSKRIGFIGAGQMASAMASGFVAADESIAPAAISFFDPAEASQQRFCNDSAGNCNIPYN